MGETALCHSLGRNSSLMTFPLSTYWIDPWRISCLAEEKRVNKIL